MDDLRPGAVGRIGWEATASVDAVAVLNGPGFQGLQALRGKSWRVCPGVGVPQPQADAAGDHTQSLWGAISNNCRFYKWSVNR